jgi:hypothetical protein
MPAKIVATSRSRHKFPVLEGDAALKFLLETGYLYRINLVDLHPVCFRFVLETRADGKVVPQIVDMRGHPEACVFTQEEIAVGRRKLSSFLSNDGVVRAARTRKRRLGYQVQKDR